MFRKCTLIPSNLSFVRSPAGQSFLPASPRKDLPLVFQGAGRAERKIVFSLSRDETTFLLVVWTSEQNALLVVAIPQSTTSWRRRLHTCLFMHSTASALHLIKIVSFMIYHFRVFDRKSPSSHVKSLGQPRTVDFFSPTVFKNPCTQNPNTAYSAHHIRF